MRALCVWCAWELVALLGVAGTVESYEVPEVQIEVLRPKGFIASVPDEPGIGLFTFNANINDAISSPDVGDVSGEVLQAESGRWSYKNRKAVIKDGDTIFYWVMVSKDKVSYVKNDLKFKFGGDPASSSTNTTPAPIETPCIRSVTIVRGQPACSGRIIFQDEFNEQTNKWIFQQYIPNRHPDYPFVSYQNIPSVINVTDGKLRIAATLLQDLPPYTEASIRSGTLDLYRGCTEAADACSAAASGPDILPPVVTGRACTKHAFTFTYGLVRVRARLARGDWFYPEILLEPSTSKYGADAFSSGAVVIGTALANQDLKSGLRQIGVTRLLGGLLVDRFQCHDRLMFSKNGPPWSDNYHDFEVKWTPDVITWSVDGEEYGRVIPTTGGLGDSLRGCDNLINILRRWSLGTKMAPFDQEFHVSLGLAAGGVTMFPDGSSGKPWSDRSSKAKLHYWQRLRACPDCRLHQPLEVDSVTVTAL